MNKFLEWLKKLFRSSPIICVPPNDNWALGLSIFMCVGMLLSYLPQHIKIIGRKSSEGLSPWYQLLGSLSMTCILSNTIILQLGLFRCCSLFTASKCAESMLGILQVLVQFVCFQLMVFLFIYFYPRDRRYIHNIDGNERTRTRDYSTALWIGVSVVSFLVFVVTMSTIIVVNFGDANASIVTEIWADVLGLFSLISSTIQFLPQIFQTYALKRVGSLSIVTMLLQTPGSFILVYTLAVRPGNNITTWITYLFTGILQGILLTMCIVFNIMEKRLAAAEHADDDEAKALLVSEEDIEISDE